MKWFLGRLTEQSSATAVMTAVSAAAAAGTGQISWQTAVGVFLASAISFLTPNNNRPAQ